MIELVRITDTGKLMSWRREVIVNVFGVEPDRELMESNLRYYRQHIADGSHLAFVALQDDNEVGCGSICLNDELPSPDNPTGRCAYLMNIYVREAFRNHGIAHKMVRHLVEVAKNLGCCKIYLESTDIAKPLYKSIGFGYMDNMMKYEN